MVGVSYIPLFLNKKNEDIFSSNHEARLHDLIYEVFNVRNITRNKVSSQLPNVDNNINNI